MKLLFIFLLLLILFFLFNYQSIFVYSQKYHFQASILIYCRDLFLITDPLFRFHLPYHQNMNDSFFYKDLIRSLEFIQFSLKSHHWRFFFFHLVKDLILDRQYKMILNQVCLFSNIFHLISFFSFFLIPIHQNYFDFNLLRNLLMIKIDYFTVFPYLKNK